MGVHKKTRIMNRKSYLALATALGSAQVLAAGSVVFDNTLPGQPAGTITTVPLVNGHYTISAANTGYLSGANLFESFSTFIVATAEEADFTNPTNLSIGNVISRVTGVGSPTGLQPTTINGSVVSTIGNANFWLINPAGVTIGAGAKINVPAGLAIGAADYIGFADGSRFYALPSNGPTPAVFSTASPTAFGFLPTPASGAVTLQGTSIALTAPITISAGPGGISLTSSSLTTTNNTPGGGSASGPDITLSSSGGPVTLQSSTLTTNNLLEPNGSATFAGAGNISLSGQTIAIHGGYLYSHSLNGGNAGSMTLAATGNAANAIQIDGGATLFSDANEANTAIVNGNIVSIGNAGSISLQAPAGGIAISDTGSSNFGFGVQTLAGDQNPSGAGAHAGQAGAISLDASQISITNADISTMAGPPNTTGVQQNAQGVTTTTPLVPASISLQASGPITVSGSTISAGTNGAVAAGDVIVGGGLVSIAGSTLNTRNSLWDGGSPSDLIQSTGNSGNINITSGGAISIQGTALNSQTQTTGSGGNITLTGSGTQGPTDGILITGGTIETGSAAAPGIVQGNAGNVILSGPSVLLSGASIDTSTIGAGVAGNVSITATGTAGVGATQGGTGDALLLTGGTTIAATSPSYNLTSGAPPGAITLAAPAGSLRIDSGSSVTSTAVNHQGGPITLAGATAITLDDASVASNAVHGGASATPQDVTLQSSGPITLSNGTTISSSTSGGPPGNNIVIETSGPVALSGNSSLISLSSRFGPAGNISVTGGSIHVTGGQINATTSAQGPAGNVTLEATGTDSTGGAALQVDGGAVVSSDATNGAFVPTASAGNILLSAVRGTVSVVGTPGSEGSSTTISSSTVSGAGGDAGTVTLTGANVSLSGATIETTLAAHLTGAIPPTITVSASGNVALANSLLDARTSGSVSAGDIRVNGSSLSVSGGQLTASTSGTATAGNVVLTATGASGANGTAALQISGGTSISSDASAGEGSQANAGSVRLIAPAGTVQVGLATDAAPSSLSTASGPIAGGAGEVAITAAGIDLGNAQISTTAASSLPNAIRGTITLDAGAGAGPLTISNSSLDAATSGVQQAGEIDLTGGAILVSNSALSSKTTGSGSAGSVCVGTPGCVAAGAAVPSTGGSVSVSGSTLTTSTSTTGTAGDIQVNGSSVSVSGGQMTASTTGIGSAGNVSLTATGASRANSAAALLVSGGASIASDAGGGASPQANAGFVKLAAPAGTVQVGLATDTAPSSLSTSAGVNAGAPGAVTVTGARVDLEDAKISTTTASTSPSTTRGTIVLDAGQGAGPLTIANSSLDAATSGVQQAGEIDFEGSPIVISNSTISSATTGTGSAGSICVSSGGPGCVAAAPAGAAGGLRLADKPLAAAAPAGGSISITGSTLSTSTSTSGTAGNITVITPGALTLTGTTIASQSTSPAANAGAVGVINLSGGSVSILGGSSVSATSQGGPAGTGGGTGAAPSSAITISSTDGTTPLEIFDSTISTKAQVVNGSNTVINAGGSQVLLQGSEISASATAGNGGNITINDAGDTVLARSAIVAQAGPGNGGAINIHLVNGAVFVQDSASIVSATSQTGNNGTVTINSPQTDLNSALRVPEVSAARTPELTANACKRDASHSTFVREGRGGVEPRPDSYLTGPVASGPPDSRGAQAPAAVPATANDSTLLASATADSGCR